MAHRRTKEMKPYIFATSTTTLDAVTDGGTTASYTNFVLEPPTGQTITINLPSCASCNGEVYTFYIWTQGGSVTINPASGDYLGMDLCPGAEDQRSTFTYTGVRKLVRMLATYQTTRSGPNKGYWIPI